MILGKYIRQLPKIFSQVSSMPAQSNSKILRKPSLRFLSTITGTPAFDEEEFSKFYDSDEELVYSDDSDSDSSYDWEAIKLKEVGCPVALQDNKWSFMHDDEHFNHTLRSKCVTLDRREHRRNHVKDLLKTRMQFFAACSTDYNTEIRLKKSGRFIEEDYGNLTNPSYWACIFTYSKYKKTIELKRKFGKAEVTMVDICVALAKIYRHLNDCSVIDYRQRDYGPEDVISVLKTSNLSEKDIQALRIVFSSAEELKWFRF